MNFHIIAHITTCYPQPPKRIEYIIPTHFDIIQLKYIIANDTGYTYDMFEISGINSDANLKEIFSIKRKNTIFVVRNNNYICNQNNGMFQIDMLHIPTKISDYSTYIQEKSKCGNMVFPFLNHAKNYSHNLKVLSNIDIYPCLDKFCGYHHKISGLDRLVYCIYFLNVTRFKDILNEYDSNDIEQYYPQFTKRYELMEYLLYCLGYSSTRKDVALNIESLDFHSFMSKPNNDGIEKKKLLEILHLLLNKCPSFANEKNINNVEIYHAIELSHVISLYLSNDPLKNPCYVCLSTSEYWMINNICDCNMPLHLVCLMQILKNTKQCKICKKPYDIHIDKLNRVLIPKLNIYPIPMINTYTKLDDTNKKIQLKYAIAYLIPNRVEEILDNMTMDEFQNYVKTCDTHAVHYFENKTLKIRNMPYTNLSRENHNIEFNMIEQMLNDKMID